MGRLRGLDEYLRLNYDKSVFDEAVADQKNYILWLHGHQRLTVRVTENLKYDINAQVEGQVRTIPKVEIKLLYGEELDDQLSAAIKSDEAVKKQNLAPILKPRQRYFIKNKSLWVAREERQVLVFTLLEGEILKGLVADFSKYEIILSLKGGLPVTILRHSIYRVKNKKGRSYLKSFQDKTKDWQNSPLYEE